MAGAHERPKGPRKQQFDARSYTQRLVVPRDADPREEARRAADAVTRDAAHDGVARFLQGCWSQTNDRKVGTDATT